jgi:glucosylceramidase
MFKFVCFLTPKVTLPVWSLLAGSVRIASTTKGDLSVLVNEDEERAGSIRVTTLENTDALPNVAFKTPEGKTVLIVANDSYSVNSFRIQYNGQFASFKLNPGAVGTYVL